MRSSRRSSEPLRLLRRQLNRRAIVVCATLTCVALLFPSPSFDDFALSLFIILICLNTILGDGTRRLAAAPSSAVDEREEAVRNRAYRLAYRILTAIAGAMIIALFSGGRPLGGRQALALMELVIYCPTALLAWLEPDRIEDDELAADAAPKTVRASTVIGVLIVAVPVVWSLGVALPARVSSNIVWESRAGDLRCGDFAARAVVGYGIEATIPVHGMVCVDGHKATEDFGLNATDCAHTSTVMTYAETTRCERRTDPDGTLRFSYHANVKAALVPFVHQEVNFELAVRPDGTVVQFPR